MYITLDVATFVFLLSKQLNGTSESYGRWIFKRNSQMTLPFYIMIKFHISDCSTFPPKLGKISLKVFNLSKGDIFSLLF